MKIERPESGHPRLIITTSQMEIWVTDEDVDISYDGQLERGDMTIDRQTLIQLLQEIDED